MVEGYTLELIDLGMNLGLGCVAAQKTTQVTGKPSTICPGCNLQCMSYHVSQGQCEENIVYSVLTK